MKLESKHILDRVSRANLVENGRILCKSAKILKLHKDFVDEKKPKGLDMDSVGKALQSYMRFQSQVEPERLAMVMLPCSMLYAELEKTEVQNSMGNVYEKD